MKLLIHAPNIHTGGGRVLVHLLIGAAQRRGNTRFVLDSRLDLPDGTDESLITSRVNPSLASRLIAELTLPTLAGKFDRVFCFGNLPPLLRLPVQTSVFVQNRYLVDSGSITGFRTFDRWRLNIERTWLRRRRKNAQHIIVQTETMRRLVRESLGVDALILPFWRSGREPSGSPTASPDGARSRRFLYPASGEPHKNHLALLAAWQRLAEFALYPTLTLTLDPFRDKRLLTTIKRVTERCNLKIENRAAASEREIVPLMRSSDAVLFPSRLESLGLPLLEALDAGIPVIASEIDVVRDILDPVQSFDPSSSESIARAVIRFLGIDAFRPRVLEPDAFLDKVCA